MEFFEDVVGFEFNDECQSQKRQRGSSQERINVAISEMMFANGDSSAPRAECVKFMHDLLKEQLLIVINQAAEIAKSKGNDNFSFTDLLQTFHRHPNFVCRLVKYASDRLMFSSFGCTFDSGTKGSNDALCQRQQAELEKFCQPFKNFDQSGSLLQQIHQYLQSNPTDHIKLVRQSRLRQISDSMDFGTYNLFSKARQRCLCYSHDRSVSKAFIEWIGQSKLDSFSVMILNFLASEIIAQMVEHALLVRAQDPTFKDWYNNANEVGIEIRHYKNALRRSLGYQLSRNILFGYVFVNGAA